jgi:AbrB family looped-hinge helix DNA binding protein
LSYVGIDLRPASRATEKTATRDGNASCAFEQEPAMTMTAEKLTTTVSTKGQVILPKAIRSRRHWDTGTRLIVEDTPDGVLLKTAPLFKPTQLDDVFGMLKYMGKPKTLEEMEAGIVAEAKRRHARGRY